MQTRLKLQTAAGALDAASTLLAMEAEAVYAVGAGPGGVPASDFSVRMVLEAVRIAFQPGDGGSLPGSVEGKARLIRNAIRAAGDALLEQPEDRRGAGATIAVLAFDASDPSRACVLNVGNCRCYRFRGGRLDMLTRSVSPEDTASDTPLLASVLDAPIGSTEHVDVSEQYLELEAGDALILAPGGVMTDAVEPGATRAFRKTLETGPQAMLEGLAEVLRENGIDEGAFVVIRTLATGFTADAPAMPAPVSAVDQTVDTVSDAQTPAPAPGEPIEADEPGEIADPVSERPVVEAGESPEEHPVEATPELETEPESEPVEEPAEEQAPGARNPVREPASPAPRSTPRPVYRVGAALADSSASAASASTPSPASAESVPTRPKPVSPLSRPTVLKPSDGVRAETGKPMALLVAIAALAVIALIGFLGYRWWHSRSQREGDEALEAGANSVDLVAQAKMTGRWGDLDRKLAKLPPLPPADDEVYRAWTAFWLRASEASASETAMRTHLETLDVFCQQAGAPPAGGPASLALPPRERADVYARLVYDKQQTLHAAITTLIEAQNRRGDFPFADRPTQQAVFAGLGQFTRGRISTRLATVQGDFLAARVAEARLASWVDKRETERPIAELTLHQVAGEPLGQVQVSLDRAWEGVLETINGLSTDTTYWKRQLRADSPLLARINRLDAVRQNVLADRRRFGDIRSWRMNGTAKPLANWILSEAAALGPLLPRTGTTAPAPNAARRR